MKAIINAVGEHKVTISISLIIGIVWLAIQATFIYSGIVSQVDANTTQLAKVSSDVESVSIDNQEIKIKLAEISTDLKYLRSIFDK